MSLVLEKSADFRHIIRLFNTNIDGKRKVAYGIRQIKGIGRRFAHVILSIARIDPNIRAGQLSEKDCQTIQNILSDPQGHGIPLWFLNRRNDWKDGTDSQLVTNGLETRLRENLERMKKIRKHRGLRHHWGLKVRGQRTKTTGRRGATMGVIKKK